MDQIWASSTRIMNIITDVGVSGWTLTVRFVVLCVLILIPLFFLCRAFLEQWRHRSDHPVIQLPAVWCRHQGVSRWGFGQDGDLPLSFLDPTALCPLCPTRPFSAQSGGQVWCGPTASQVQGERHAQTWLGEKQEQAMLRLAPCS